MLILFEFLIITSIMIIFPFEKFANIDSSIYWLIWGVWGMSILLMNKRKINYYQSKYNYIISSFTNSYIFYFFVAIILLIVTDINNFIVISIILSLYSIIEITVISIMIKNAKQKYKTASNKFATKYIQVEYDLPIVTKENSDKCLINAKKNKFNIKSKNKFNIILRNAHSMLKPGELVELNIYLTWVSMSKYEILGRIAYHGFNCMEYSNEKRQIFLSLRKVRSISDNPFPSSKFIIALNRISINGEIIKVYKIRSMYPYSEFLQKIIYEENDIDNSGKFLNDPRITKFGKFIRKYWLDELPQFINLFRGDIKLVGIRAMSQHYFSLYSEEYKQLYIQVKPGLISPIFDKNTNSFADIEETELRYLKAYINKPLFTDIKYFFITFFGIIKGIRSK